MNQFEKLSKSVGDLPLVTMSAGNYGRSFTHACVNYNMKGIVLLPEFAPDSRQKFIEVNPLNALVFFFVINYQTTY